MPDRDWAKHGITNPPDNGDRWQRWQQDISWIILEKLEIIEKSGCRRGEELGRAVETLIKSAAREQEVVSGLLSWKQSVSSKFKLLPYICVALAIAVSALGGKELVFSLRL